MSDCETRRKFISSDIYTLGLINGAKSPEINKDNCTAFYQERKDKKPFTGNLDECKKQIDYARMKYQGITEDCPPSGGMRKRRKSRRTKRKRNTLKKNKRTKRRSLKKTRRTRKRTRRH